ncbi:shikimate dehydrogenase family protein [Leucobacter sp. GX24907]
MESQHFGAAEPARLRVLGSPIAHSRSPLIHRAAYEVLGLDWEFDRDELVAADLEGYLAERSRGWRGFAVTMPLKEEAYRLSALRDPVAEESGVVNTMLRLDTDDPRWAGFNTDVLGLAAAISKAGLDATRTAVIGSGATAVSAVLAARRLGAEHVEVVARNEEAAAALVQKFSGSREPGAETGLRMSTTHLLAPAALERLTEAGGATASGTPTLVISTLPGPAGTGLVLPEQLAAAPLFDVAYDPWPSPLATHWQHAGGRAHAGIGMLVEQALIQVRIFVRGDGGAELEDEEALLAGMWRAVGEQNATDPSPGTGAAADVER